MGNHYIIKEETLTNIADNIREKLGTEDSYSPDDMASGVNEVYEAGKQAEYDAFWDMVQLGGERTYYSRGFMYWGWEIADPKYKVTTTAADYLFGQNKNLKTINAEKFDLSNNGENIDMSGICRECSSLEVFPDLGAQRISSIASAFLNASKLHTIEIIRFQRITSIGTTTFNGCNSLRNITTEGSIGGAMNFSSSPLTVDSMKNIVLHLYDYTGTSYEYKYTVTFKTSAFEALEAEGATAEYNGTPCTWAELIGFLKWNLVKA